MKDYSKVKEAQKLLQESGVQYSLAYESEDAKGIYATAALQGKTLAAALTSIVNGAAEQTKMMGVPEESFGLEMVRAVCIGVKLGYGTLPDEVK